MTIDYHEIGEKEMETYLSYTKFQFRKMKKAKRQTAVMLATTMCIYLIPLNCTLKIDEMQTLCCIYFTTMKKINFKWKENRT